MQTDTVTGMTTHDNTDVISPIHTYVNAVITPIITWAKQRLGQSFVWASAVSTPNKGTQTGMLDGAYGYETSTRTRWIYDGSTSTWRQIWDQPGTIPVIPTVTGTGISVSPSGLITFTAATGTVFVNGFASAAFPDYEFEIDIPTTSVANSINMQLVASGAADTTANYDGESLTGSTTTASASNSAATSWGLNGSRVSSAISGKLIGPFKAQRTALIGTSVGYNATGGSAIVIVLGNQHRLANSYDGIALIISTGTITGTMRIRGINSNNT